MTREQLQARRQARARASAQGLTVHRVREDRRLPYHYFAATSRDQAISLLLRGYDRRSYDALGNRRGPCGRHG